MVRIIIFFFFRVFFLYFYILFITCIFIVSRDPRLFPHHDYVFRSSPFFFNDVFGF